MKKILYTLALLALVACTGEKVPADQGSSYFFHENEEPNVEVKTDSIHYVKADGPWEFGLSGVYPSGRETALNRAVREWINEELGGTYESDLADTALLCAHYAQKYLDDQEVDLTEQFLQDSIQCISHYNISLQWENDSLVTFLLTNEWYGGGAHGAYQVWGATFRKSDGRRFGTDMLLGGRLPNEELQTGLKSYFEVETNEELEEQLMLGINSSVEYLPMPTTSPWIEEDGLHLVYQQYEIACYAAGMPALVVPMNRLPEYVTATMKQNLKIKK